MAKRNWLEELPMMSNFQIVAVFVLILPHCCISGQDFPALSHIKPSASAGTQAQAAVELIQRVAPSHGDYFTVQIDTGIGPSDKDTFKLVSNNGKISITATSGVGAAMGFYYYIKEYCGAHISWAGNQVNLPDTLPDLPPGGITITTNDRFRYYQNVCTVSYSFVWWDWTRWQQEIDWMAMQGINFPLAFNAQEAILQRVLLKMNFTQADIDVFLSGPAFLAWFRMGNLQGWGGPMPQSWHTAQVALQHQILDRMRSLGIIPILPAFSGHVPQAFPRVYPNSKVIKLSNWGSLNSTYTGVYLLDFQDPLFVQIGKAFITEYTSEFGTDHVYNTDTFNEMTPAFGDPSYLSSAGKAVFEAMTAGDDKAIWLMQGWLFEHNTTFWQAEQVEALLTAVPQGRMIILDLYSEIEPQYSRLQSYYGQPFIWCMLHDFGGTVAMYGDLTSINKGPFDGRAMENSTMIGIGLTPEGINQNNIVYEFMMENAWRTEPRNISQWLTSYATQRYGKADNNADAGWQFLGKSLYNCTDGQAAHGHGKNLIVKRPAAKRARSDIWYNPEQLFQAWDNFIKAAENLGSSDLFRYDLVDVTRQSLQVIAVSHYTNMMTAYKAKDLVACRDASALLLSLLADMDYLLGTDEHFLLGAWIETAKSWATNDQEAKIYEYNARNQVTLWGPNGNILDYANKQWSGLMKSYYRQRWVLFCSELIAALQADKSFDQKQYNSDVFKRVEEPFTFDRSLYPNTTIGDSVTAALELHTLYRPVTQKKAKFFEKLPDFSAKKKKFLEYATRWTKRNKQKTKDRRPENDVYYMGQSKRKNKMPEIYFSHLDMN